MSKQLSCKDIIVIRGGTKYRTKNRNQLSLQTIVEYLFSQGYIETVQTLKHQSKIKLSNSQLNLSANILYCQQILRQGAQSMPMNFQQFFCIITKNINPTSEQFIKLQLYLHIWYCINQRKKCIIIERLPHLKQYLTHKAEQLAHYKQLLGYFALPYIDQPRFHHFLKKIFTPQWQQQLENILIKVMNSAIQQERVNLQWYSIVQDLIGICNELYKKCQYNCSSLQLIERVKKYEQTLEKYHNIQISDNLSMDLKNIKNIIKQKWQQNNQQDLSYLYYNLRKQISKNLQIQNMIIEEDTLQLNDIEDLSLQRLKLIYKLCHCYEGRRYICKKNKFINLIINELIFTLNKIHVQCQKFQQSKIYILMGIFQKISISTNCFIALIKHRQFIEKQLQVLEDCCSIFISQRKSIFHQHIILYTLALFMNIVLHVRGRKVLQQTLLFEKIFQVLNTIQNIQTDSRIQQFAYSILYILLQEPEIIHRAQKIGFKEVILNRMLSRADNEQYTRIVQYIIQRMENPQQQNQQSDTDRDQDDNQEDLSIQDEGRWVGQNWLPDCSSSDKLSLLVNPSDRQQQNSMNAEKSNKKSYKKQNYTYRQYNKQ